MGGEISSNKLGCGRDLAFILSEVDLIDHSGCCVEDSLWWGKDGRSSEELKGQEMAGEVRSCEPVAVT